MNHEELEGYEEKQKRNVCSGVAAFVIFVVAMLYLLKIGVKPRGDGPGGLGKNSV